MNTAESAFPEVLPLSSLPGSPAYSGALAPSEGRVSLATWGLNRIYTIDPATFTVLSFVAAPGGAALPMPPCDTSCLAVDASTGDMFATDREGRLYRLRADGSVAVGPWSLSWVRAIAWDETSSELHVGCDADSTHGGVRVMDRDFVDRGTYDTGLSCPGALAASASLDSIALAHGGEIRIFRLSTRELVTTVKLPDISARGVALTRSGGVALGADDLWYGAYNAVVRVGLDGRVKEVLALNGGTIPQHEPQPGGGVVQSLTFHEGTGSVFATWALNPPTAGGGADCVYRIRPAR